MVKYRKTILTLRQFLMHTKKMQNVEKGEADYFLMNDLKIIQNTVLSSKLSLLSSSSSFCYSLLNPPPTNHLLSFQTSHCYPRLLSVSCLFGTVCVQQPATSQGTGQSISFTDQTFPLVVHHGSISGKGDIDCSLTKC